MFDSVNANVLCFGHLPEFLLKADSACAFRKQLGFCGAVSSTLSSCKALRNSI